ncbi:MAG: SRPBCC family protein [Sterolibacterium sp.]
MPNLMHRILLCLLPGLIWLLPAGAEAAPGADIEVAVRVDGETVHVDVNFLVQATPSEAWAVMTDFGHMQDFISNLTSSQELSRDGNLVVVAQKGKASAGPFSYEFDSLREFRLTPFEQIRMRQLGGSMKMFKGTTLLAAENGYTRISHHSDAIPDVWIPPLVGRKFIASETREQFAELRQEILRRKQSAEKSSIH